MPHEIKESDWKVFRDLHKVALDRYYVRAISELQPLVLGNAGTSRERYLKLLKLTDDRREELGRLFDDFRRSTALFQLAMICRQNLLTAEEMSRFSAEARAMVEMFLNFGKNLNSRDSAPSTSRPPG